MTTAASNIVFDDIFTINAIDKEGKKFDRGSSNNFLVQKNDTKNQVRLSAAPPTSVPLICPFQKLRHGPNVRLQRRIISSTRRTEFRSCIGVFAFERAGHCFRG